MNISQLPLILSNLSLHLLVLGNQSNGVQLPSPFYVLLNALLQLVQVSSTLHETVADYCLWEFAESDAFVALFQVAQFCPIFVDFVDSL